MSWQRKRYSNFIISVTGPRTSLPVFYTTRNKLRPGPLFTFKHGLSLIAWLATSERHHRDTVSGELGPRSITFGSRKLILAKLRVSEKGDMRRCLLQKVLFLGNNQNTIARTCNEQNVNTHANDHVLPAHSVSPRLWPLDLKTNLVTTRQIKINDVTLRRCY